MKKDLYAEIANGIIEQLEKGIIPWNKPWASVRSGAISHATGRAYSLINQLMLGRPGEYATWNQVQQEGGRVKKGAKAKSVVFWKIIDCEKKDEDGHAVLDDHGNVVMRPVPVLRYFQVFHIDDCEGIKVRYPDKLPAVPADPVAEAEKVFGEYLDKYNITLEQTKSNRAYYSPVFDLIHLPLREQFESTSEYYGTAFHEATHSTGHESRLNRLGGALGAAAFGSEEYSKEELVAEIGSACVLHELGILTPDTIRNSAAYCQGWLRALKDDKRMIVSAAARAEKAVKMILDIDGSDGDGE